MSTPEIQARPLTLAVAELFPRRGEWTEADYLPLAERNRLVELSEGELVVPPMPTTRHQNIVGNVYVALRAYVQGNNLGRVGLAPLPVRLWQGKMREPDVMVMLRAHLNRVHEQYWEPPDLVVEVVSSGTRKVDRTEKLHEYAQAAIPEYWIVEPETQTVEVYALAEQGYQQVATCRAPAEIISRVLEGYTLSVSDIFGG